MFGLNSKKDDGIGAELDMGSLVRRHELESGQSEESDESDHLTQANHIAKVIIKRRVELLPGYRSSRWCSVTASRIKSIWWKPSKSTQSYRVVRLRIT